MGKVRGSARGDNSGDYDESKGGVEADDKEMTKKGKANQATTKKFATIADNYDGVLEFLQAIAVKSP